MSRMLKASQLADVIQDPGFEGFQVGEAEIPADQLLEHAKTDEEIARQNREIERLEAQLDSLEGDDRRRLTLTNSLRIAQEKRIEAMARAMAECFALGIPVQLSVGKGSLRRRVEAMFDRGGH